MLIKINGKNETIDSPTDLAKIVSGKALVPDHIVVEHNMRIVPKNEWGNTIIQENDTIEIVSFVGGG